MENRGVISKGITLSYKDEGAGEFMTLTNLQEIPELGGDTDSIEITVLSDAAHTYTNGIKNYGDSLTFKFLYETDQFEQLLAHTDELLWKVELPDSTTCQFNGVGSVKLDGVGINSVLTYTLNIKPSSEMLWS